MPSGEVVWNQPHSGCFFGRFRSLALRFFPGRLFSMSARSRRSSSLSAQRIQQPCTGVFLPSTQPRRAHSCSLDRVVCNSSARSESHHSCLPSNPLFARSLGSLPRAFGVDSVQKLFALVYASLSASSGPPVGVEASTDVGSLRYSRYHGGWDCVARRRCRPVAPHGGPGGHFGHGATRG